MKSKVFFEHTTQLELTGSELSALRHALLMAAPNINADFRAAFEVVKSEVDKCAEVQAQIQRTFEPSADTSPAEGSPSPDGKGWRWKPHPNIKVELVCDGKEQE